MFQPSRPTRHADDRSPVRFALQLMHSLGEMPWIGLIGIDVINHYTLRFILYLKRCIPKDYVKFLNHCVDLIFLRRVGVGYIFVHRLLMEHFAEMYKESD